jgi:hypothetical protein
MKKLAILGCLAVLASACGSDNNSPNGPSALPTTVVFTAALNPANEVPPVTNADATGRGTGTFTLNLTRDGAGTITAASATFVYSLTGFPNGTSVILSHIHEGGPAIAGPVKVNTGLSAANALVLADGTLTNQTFSNIAVDAGLAQQIIDNPNGYYLNVHTAINPGGAVRGQLVKQ